VGRSVLVVDDHEGFRAWACAFLRAEGYDVVGEAADGLTTLREVDRLRPEVVLLDIHLPDIDGFEVARRLCQGVQTSIVLISSREPEEFGDRVQTSCARGFLPKADLFGASLEAIISDPP
jgi:DNA-binding NarL/FixJ family response regulator